MSIGKCSLQVLVVGLLLGMIHPTGNAQSAEKDGPLHGRPFHVNRSVPPAVIVDGEQIATIVCPNGCSPTFADGNPVHLFYVGDTMRYSPPVSVTTAVRFLVDGVERITGRKLVVVEEGAPVVGPQIHVGPTKYAKKVLGNALKQIDREGYILLSTPEGLVVCGGDAYGTVFAVSALLERYAGARWFFPDEMGKVFPQQERLVLAGVNWRDEPAYKSREIPGCEHTGLFNPAAVTRGVEWQLWNGIRYGRYRFHHNLMYLLPASVYAKVHPEWYPVINGKRTVPEPGTESASWKPCLSAPGLVEEVARLVIAYFDAHPEEESFSIGQCDGGGWCECDACTKLDGEDATRLWGDYSGRYSRRVVIFGNRVAELVAKKYPDKTLGFLAYSNYIVPPEGLKMHPMLMPCITSTRDSYVDPEFRKRDEAITEGWGRMASKTGLYEYMYGVGLFVPRIYTGTIAGALRRAYAHGARGWFCEAFPNWGLDAPKLHALAKLLWNPDSDPDVLRKDFCDKLFGPAAGPMYDLFLLVEKAWAVPLADGRTRGGWFLFFPGNPAQLLPYTPEVVAAMNAKCAEARKLAATDKQAAERVEYFAKCYGMVNLLVPGYRAQQLIQQGASMREVLEAIQPDDRPVMDKLRAYALEHHFGFFEIYPSFGYPWNEYFKQLRGGDEEVNMITSGFGRQLAREMIGQAGVTGAGSSVQFTEAFNAALDGLMKERLGAVQEGSRLASYAVKTRAWATKVAPAFRTAVPPVIDGKLDEAVWQSAVPGRDFSVYITGKPVETRTRFAACYDDANLYLGVWCDQPSDELAAVKPAQYRDEWDRNSVEIFLGKEGESSPAWQIVPSRGGSVWDGCNGEPSWNPAGLRCAGNVAGNQWMAELAIPWKDIGMDAKKDRVIVLNVVRNRCYKLPDGNLADEISTWFLSAGGHIVRKNRGYLLLEQ